MTHDHRYVAKPGSLARRRGAVRAGVAVDCVGNYSVYHHHWRCRELRGGIGSGSSVDDVAVGYDDDAGDVGTVSGLCLVAVGSGFGSH